VSMMVLPMACAIMRQVFSQTPPGEKEAALALGSTKWGMIRTVVLPFGKGGIIGGTMLSLGRALGETIAVLLIINQVFQIKPNVLETGTATVSSTIAAQFGEATGIQLKALLTAGFVLFVITLVVNTLAAIVVNRSRSGSETS
jgi:phosphate transport system permease protein